MNINSQINLFVMKRNMKLMHIYQIQKLHRFHKERLSSINSVNNRLKTFHSVSSNIEKINTYKRSKIQSQNFQQKQRVQKISIENRNLHSRMMELTLRQNSILRDSKAITSSHLKHRKNSNLFEKLNQDNIRLKQKISKTKSSNYKNDQTLSQSRKLSRQSQLINLMEKQLKIKPKVVFPVLDTTVVQRKEVEERKQRPKDGLKRQKSSLNTKKKMDRHRSLDARMKKLD